MAERLSIPVKGAGNAEGIEVFPKHDEIKEGGFGNAIRGPLGIHRTISARYWFYGADYSFDAQLAYLARVAKLSEDSLRSLIGKVGDSVVTESKPQTRRDGVPHPEVRVQFRILDHVEVRRKVGRNWIARCPSCAAAGHDTSKDNLAISVEEPQKYICWAGCTKEMIRAALGVPVHMPAVVGTRA